MTTFALVHGAWHGAWCWERLVPEIEGHGHAAIAVDLPCDDVEAGVRGVRRGRSGADRAGRRRSRARRALAGRPDDPARGCGAPGAQARLPVRAPAAPRRGLRRPGRARSPASSSPARAAPSATIRIARSGRMRTRRPTRSTAGARVSSRHGRPRACGRRRASRSIEPCPLAEWPAVESVSIFTSDDAIVNPEWSRTAARDRLGANTVELPGGHSPFLGRPAELAEVLL